MRLWLCQEIAKDSFAVERVTVHDPVLASEDTGELAQDADSDNIKV